MSWFDWVPAIITGAADIYGNITKNDANNQAAGISQDATRTATGQLVSGLNQSIGSYDASKTNDTNMQQQSAPGVYQQQKAIADQNVLTPAQQLAIDQARQQNATQLAASGLGGSGRANVASNQFVTDNTTANFMNQNRARADTAGSALSGQYFNAGQDINTQNTNIGNAQQKIGQANAASTLDIGAIQSGNVNANAGVNTSTAQNIAGTAGGAISGAASNDIKSMIAQANKTRSSYGPGAVGGGQDQPQRQTL